MRHRVGERLQRVGRVGEPVDDRDRRVLGELVDLGLVERADHDRAQEAREDERRVAVDSPRASWSSAAGTKSAIPPSSAIPTSKLTRVRVDGLWKISPTSDPGGPAAPGAARARPSARRRGRAASRARPRVQSATRVKLRPLSVVGTPGHAPMLLAPPGVATSDRVARMSTFADALNEQIGVRVRARRSSTSRSPSTTTRETLPQLAAHFYRQAVEERNHAMMMVQYLLDADEQVVDPRRRGTADVVRRRRRAGRARARPGEARHGADRRARASSRARRATSSASSSCTGSCRSSARRSRR